jgi:hypothetical protein
MKRAKLRGRTVAIVNPAFPCGAGLKPVHKITDRAKRYRANSAACRPAGPKVCTYCKSRRNVEVHHRDGNESNGAKKNLGWACRRCNTALGAAFKRAGLGKRTRQYNGRKTKGHTPEFTQYGWAIGMICRKADQRKGLCSPSSDPKVLEAVEIIRSTPADKRREYSRRAAASRGRWASEVPF